MNYVLAMALGLLLVAGCTKKESLIPENRKVVDMKPFQEDRVVPNPLFEEILKLHKPLAMDPGAEGKEEKGEKKESEEEKKEDKDVTAKIRSEFKTKPPIEQVPFKIYLVEKSKGILGGQNLELQYSAGGGILDYKLFLQSPQPGYFTLGAEFDKDLDPKDLHVFYLSNAKVRALAGRNIGNGCDRYFDITKFWNDQRKSGGMELFTGDNRHISLTAGVFFFVIPAKGKLHLAHLTVKDSRFKDLECGKE